MACEIHTDPVDRLVKYFICLAGRGAGARLARAGVPPARAVQLPAAAEVQALFAQLIREGQARTRLSGAISEALFQLTLLKIQEAIARRPGRPQPGYERYLRVREVIDAQAGRLRSLAEVARLTGVPPVAACKLFAQHLGQSPFRYLMRRKMELAAEYLMRGGGLVKEAAAHVGFADPHHFSRRFKAAHGVSPTTLRSGRSPRRREGIVDHGKSGSAVRGLRGPSPPPRLRSQRAG
jgi:AraC-like DNA-binding protein